MPEDGNGNADEAAVPVASAQAIPEPQLPLETRRLRFSFRHLDLTNNKFRLADCSDDFLRQLLARVRDYSNWTVDDFIDQNNNEHRHVIWFPQTSEPHGFDGVGIDADQLAYHDAWQFQICQEEDWRVHGILIDDTFYVIWLDPNHQLYPN